MVLWVWGMYKLLDKFWIILDNLNSYLEMFTFLGGEWIIICGMVFS
jgi:hypothetical protein